MHTEQGRRAAVRRGSALSAVVLSLASLCAAGCAREAAETRVVEQAAASEVKPVTRFQVGTGEE